MALQGNAFLALWNDVEPGREDEYERWHQSEHVPERVSIPGMLAARRYLRSEGDQQQFFTLYEAAGLEVFASAAYLAVADRPTPWSLSMRPSLRGFLRQPCTTRLTTGVGVAAHVLAVRFRSESGLEFAEKVRAWQETEEAAATVHLGRADPDARFPVPNTVETSTDGQDSWVLIVESGRPARLHQIIRSLVPWLAEQGASNTQLGQYALISALRHDEVGPALWQKGRSTP
jgi:hypothetical protein